MTEITSAPDISRFDIPKDQWTTPFWEAAALKELKVPRCASCGTHRWPAGPFCPSCRSQDVEWVAAGPAVLYSYTVVRQPGRNPEDPVKVIAPALIEFPEAGGVRIVAALVDTPVDAIRIGAPLALGWNARGEDNVPVFSIG